MPYKEKQIERLYYPIGEVAEMFGVSTSLIRFWEKEFDILQPRKNRKGDRLFTQKDLKNLRMIYHLVKERGYTLKGARQKLQDNPDDTIRQVEIADRLKKLRSFLEDLRESL